MEGTARVKKLLLLLVSRRYDCSGKEMVVSGWDAGEKRLDSYWVQAIGPRQRSSANDGGGHQHTEKEKPEKREEKENDESEGLF